MADDTLLKNGIVIDGTGARARHANVAITGGRIVQTTELSRNPYRTIHVEGLVVAPGFIDPHTHYGTQICWDGATTPSSWHGMTTVVMGTATWGLGPADRRRERLRCGI